MATKKTNVEELEQQYLESEKTTKMLLEKFLQAKKEEEEKKKAKLEAEKQKRYDEVVDAYEKFAELKSKFVDDYGSFMFKTTNGRYNEMSDWVLASLGLL